MSKSLGNLVFVGDLLKEWEPAAVRLALLAHHYRPDWEWRPTTTCRAAAARLERLAARRDRLDDRAVAGLRAGLRCVRPSTTTSTRRPRCAALDDEAAAGPIGRPAGAALLGVTL